MNSTNNIDVTEKGTLCYLLRNSSGGELEVCLGKHKKHGKWNGFGGKVGDKEEFKNESIEESVIREGKEEFNIIAKELKKVGEISFIFPDQNKHTLCHVFVCDKWTNSNNISNFEINGSDELSSPTWFTLDNLPWNDMWDDDREWLELVLTTNKFVKAQFVFDQHNKVMTSIKTTTL